MTTDQTKTIEEIIEEDSFFFLSKKALDTLDNLVKNNQVAIPVQPSTFLDIAIGAVAESQANQTVDLLEVFNQHPEFLYDSLFFDRGGEYNLQDVLAQVICFRLVRMMEEFLDHMNVEYITSFPDDDIS